MDSQVEDFHSRAESLVAKFQRGDGANYIDEAIVLDREALALCPPGHAKLPVSLSCLASHLRNRYTQLRAVEDLDEAILLNRDALALCPPGHPDRGISLHNLARDLYARYRQAGAVEDLNEAIVLNRDALALRSPGHPDRPLSLNNLAVFLKTRYDQLGAMGDLNEAIALDRDGLALRPPGHPDRSRSLNNLALHLSVRYRQLGVAKDLNEAISLSYDSLGLRPPGHPNRSSSMSTLAANLAVRYTLLGALEDLNEAIVLNRDALALHPPGHPEQLSFLHDLAYRLASRYERLGTLEDLNEAIVLDRDVLALCPPGNPGRSTALNNLAVFLKTRYDQLGGVEDLDEAISLDLDALVLCPPGHPRRSMSLYNLASHLFARYNRLGASEDLKEAILLNREGLALRPPGHPGRPESLNNLAVNLCDRYKQDGSVGDLDEAIVLSREAMLFCPPGHPDRSRLLAGLARHLRARFTQPSRSSDKDELFGLYAQLAHAPLMVSSADLFVAREWTHAAEDFHHPTTLLAYQTSLRLLIHHLATFPSLPRHHTVLKGLTSSLAVDAFSACLRNHSLTNAVELLEQGRSVFWNQLTRLNSPIDDVVASGPAGEVLADEFTSLTFLIRKALDSPGPDQHDRVCNLNVELQKVVTKIRDLPGLSYFLLPSHFSDLRQAACGGPVIIVNASKYGCDVLVVLLDHDPVHIPLSITKEGVLELSSKLRALTVRARSMNVGRDLCLLLRALWDEVVLRIVDVLQVMHPPGSRIWWCPTGEFSVLPLHAAGPYRKGQQNLVDIYVSSYTPTLTALNRARRHDSLRSASKEKRFVAIGQATAAGESELFSVGAELAKVGEHVGALGTFTRIEGQESCIERVAEELCKNEWVHLACHGVPNPKRPFESGFALHDGRFTIERIIRCELEDPQFAYLSACHTTVGDEESPDEVIHLASAMQFAGFRSVIGTMWAVDDDETGKITSAFYDNIKDESGSLDYTRAALALNKTMKELTDVSFDQRVLYIHLGA